MNDKESMVLPKARILVVDDETSIRELCVRILGRTYEVSPAPDGPTAISMARAQTPDLLLTDIRMPGMTGLEAARQIVAEAPDDSVVVMTGFSEFDNLLETVKLGVNGCLMKPFTPDDLRKTVEEGLRKGLYFKRNTRLRAEAPAADAGRMLSVPGQFGGRVVGVVAALRSTTAFGGSDRDVLRVIAAQGSSEIEKMRLSQQLRRSYWNTVYALAATVDLRDH